MLFHIQVVVDSSSNNIFFLGSKRIFYLNICLQYFQPLFGKVMTKILISLALAHIQHTTTLLKQF